MTFRWPNCDCGLTGGCELCNPMKRELPERDAWWRRMSREDIAAELSATFDLGLDTTRKIADWILAAQEDDLSKLPTQQKLTEEDMEAH